MFSPRTSTTTRSATRLLALGAAGLATLVAAPAAHAVSIHTTWNSIDMQVPATGGPSLFWQATDRGRIQLAPYQPNDRAEQWAPVQSQWPRSPDITSSDPFGDFIDAVGECIVNLGCPFTASVGAPHKLVNRRYGTCVTMSSHGQTTDMRLTDCGFTTRDSKPQVFAWNFSNSQLQASAGVPPLYTALAGERYGDTKCLASKFGADTAGTTIVHTTCVSPSRSDQQFRFLHSGDATCNGVVGTELCGIGPGPRVFPAINPVALQGPAIDVSGGSGNGGGSDKVGVPTTTPTPTPTPAATPTPTPTPTKPSRAASAVAITQGAVTR